MELTKEKVLELHRKMWTAMQKSLGDNPDAEERAEFKYKWCDEHFPKERVCNDCFLCEYGIKMAQNTGDYDATCDMFCPIDWKKGGLKDCCSEFDGGGAFYESAPLSVILALPERETEDVPIV